MDARVENRLHCFMDEKIQLSQPWTTVFIIVSYKKRCSKLMNNIHVIFRTKYFNIHIVNKLGRYLDLSIKIDKKWSCDMPIMLSELP